MDWSQDVKRNQRFCCGLLLVVLLGSSNVSRADSFQYSSFSATNEQFIQITSPINAAGGMGQIVVQGSGPNSGQTLLAWCLDIYHSDVSSGIYNISPLTTAGSGGLNPPLTTNQISEIGSLMLHGNALIATSSNTDLSAANQLAIWLVEYGSAFQYTGVTTSVTNLALTLISFVDSPSGQWYCSDCRVNLFSEANVQTLGTGFEAPLPGALPLFGSGLVALGLLGLRKKRPRRTALAG